MSTDNKTIAGGVRKLFFDRNRPTNLFNVYTIGSGVGALTPSVRRALYRRAAMRPGTMQNPAPRTNLPCCFYLKL